MSDVVSQSTSQQSQRPTWSAVTAVGDAGGVGRGVRGAPQADRTTGLAVGAAAGFRIEALVALGRAVHCEESMIGDDEEAGLGWAIIVLCWGV